MNSIWAPEEVRAGLELTELAVILTDAERGELMGAAGALVIDLERDLPGLIQRHAGATLAEVAVGEDDPAVVLFTSGTAGRAKGATHSHRNVIAALWSTCSMTPWPPRCAPRTVRES